jgi:hypothetical protein
MMFTVTLKKPFYTTARHRGTSARVFRKPPSRKPSRQRGQKSSPSRVPSIFSRMSAGVIVPEVENLAHLFDAASWAGVMAPKQTRLMALPRAVDGGSERWPA